MKMGERLPLQTASRRGRTTAARAVSVALVLTSALVAPRGIVASGGQRELRPAGARRTAKGFAASLATIAPGAPHQRPPLMADDNRKLQNATSRYPWSTICKLFVEFRDHSQGGGTGVLIGPGLLLTA